MLEIKDDIWKYYNLYSNDYICITTNGTIKRNGEAVMGKGIAAQAKKRFPRIEQHLGLYITTNGHIVQPFWPKLISFPVKYNWYEIANLKLIEDSCIQLVELSKNLIVNNIYLPRPGCYNGRRNWLTEVKPICEKYFFDSCFIICDLSN